MNKEKFLLKIFCTKEKKMCKKYLKAYYNIINRAFLQNRNKSDGHYEGHHVKLNCFGGKRIVLLTAREHYLVHFLIYKHFKSLNDKSKMIKTLFAFNQMTWCSKDNIKRYNSHTFDIARKEFSKNIRGKNHPFYGKKHSIESRNKIKESLNNMSENKKNIMRQRQRDAAKLREKQSIETKEKRSKSLKEYYSNKEDKYKLILPNGDVKFYNIFKRMIEENGLSKSMCNNAKSGEKIKLGSEQNKIRSTKVINTINCIIYKLKGD